MKSRFLVVVVLMVGALQGKGQAKETMPEFKIFLNDTVLHVDTQAALVNFIERQLQFPEVAKEKGILGSVKLKLTVNAKFHFIDNIEIAHLSDPVLRTEVLRIVSLLSNWRFYNGAYFFINFRFDSGQGQKTFSKGEFVIYNNVPPAIEK